MTDEFVLEIMEKFNASDVVDLDFSRNGTHLSLKKKEACVANITVENKSTSTAKECSYETAVITSSVEENSEKSAKAVEKESVEVTKKDGKTGTDLLKSPIVGTFYRAPSPDSPAYAEKGKKIKKGEPVCIIEAMKMMNTLNADYDLEIVDVLVENGELVEYDQPLFSIIKL